ncbi:molybdopterin-dependent oxidoreductase [Chloroflexota bacterium]
MSRRAFLGISGGAAAGIAGFLAVKWPSLDLSLPSEDVAEGIVAGYKEDDWIFTSCLNCPTRCAVKVRKVILDDGKEKAVRIIGNTNSAYSDGKTCPRSHIGLQVLYNPDRIEKPLKRKAGASKGINQGLSWEQQFEEITWDEALTEIKGQLDNLSPAKLLIIQGLNTTSDEDLISRFATSFGTPNLLREDILDTAADRAGKKLADGCDNHGYDLENSNYVLSFGADIIESETPLARNLRLWGKIRRERPNKARIVVIDPRYSVTASKADEWIPINPGTEGDLAMAIAHVIISENLYDTDFVDNRTSGFDNYKTAVLANFSPGTVAGRTGVDADTIVRIAREFAQDKPAIAWSGAGATSWPHGSYASHAIFCLNALVGSIDVPGGVIYQETPAYKGMTPDIGTTDPIRFDDAADLIFNGNVEVVIGFNNNLVMSVPDTKAWDTALAEELPYYIHIAPSRTEMAQFADIILPSRTYLEEWAYESAPPGSGYAEAKIKQPVLELFADSRPTAEIVFNLANSLGGTVANDFENIGDTPKGFVQFRTDTMWNDLINKGAWIGPDYEYAGNNPAKYDTIFKNVNKKFSFNSDNLNTLLTPEFQGNESDYPFKLATYHPVLDIRNGNQNYPWAQEFFLVMHGYGWKNFVEMNKHDADEKGIKDGDRVWVQSVLGKDKRIKAKARVFEGIKPGTVAIANGQGHTSCGEWADGMGVNPKEVINIDYDDNSGQASFRNTRVKIYKA